MTFESLLAGPTFARCTFKGALRGTKLGDERHVYIYKEDFAQQYDKCQLYIFQAGRRACAVNAQRANVRTSDRLVQVQKLI